ncbi:uncharacterized protein FA14DRAFT_159814 [Meira miltonrushii]|uniref:Pkr1-domain-containing protein n=1 Tax=Meira miltonrushii TaxID=1280837 RepID=A0A316VKD3_9BASI|nr:uncharacterized protein FA14DRAFT_159814 [Meira miltonrushii]PWN38069.1 hypothetical protein FA14DRAFT_159814 [Meira miltonrushii]
MSSAQNPTSNKKPPSSFLESVFDSLWQPGLNTPMRRVMDMSFMGLFFVLFTLIFLTNFNIHVIALFCISIGLFLSIHWFLNELDKMPPSATQIQQMPTEADQAEGISNQSETKKAQ